MTKDTLFDILMKSLSRGKKKKPAEISKAVSDISLMFQDFISQVGRCYIQQGFGEDVLYDIMLAGNAIAIRQTSGAPLAWEDFKKVEEMLFNMLDPKDMERMKEEVSKDPVESMLCDDPTCESCNLVRKIASGEMSDQLSMDFPSTFTKH